MSGRAEAPLTRRLYGRQQGRPLSQRQKRLLSEVLPELAVSLPAPGETLDPEALFGPGIKKIWLEVGFGAGEHLAWQAENQARLGGDVGFIGAEFFTNGIAKLLSGLDPDLARRHIRIYRGDACLLLAALPVCCLDRVFVLFPDPWSKRRHHKRRFICQSTLDHLATAMRAGAELRFATDDVDYLTWSLECLTKHPNFRWMASWPNDFGQRPDDWPRTRYEAKALLAGRLPNFLVYRRGARNDAGD